MKKTIVSAMLSAALLAGSVLGGSVMAYAEAADDTYLNIGWNSDMQTMDVHKTTSNYAIPLAVFDRLFEVKLNDDGTSELVKSLAADYSISDDGLVYTFTLRDDVKFSDGTPMTAQDVVYTFTRMFALEDSVQTDFTDSIVGAKALMNGEADTLEGVKALDDLTVEITLEEPFAAFLSILATPTCCIFSEANVEEAGDDFGIEPSKTIGSGPYMVTEWTPNDRVVLERNPYYWGEPASAAVVTCKIYPEASSMNMAFQNGDIDVLDCDYIDSAIVESVYKTAYADSMVSANRLATTYLALNENVEPLNDVKVRKAIQMAIDRQTILDTLYMGAGTVVDGIYPVGSIGYTEENQGWLKYDPEGAKALLEEAGYADGFDLELSADASASSSIANVLQIVQQNLQAIGINAHIENYDEAAWLTLRKSGEMPTFTATWTLDYNDPSNIIDTFFSSPESGTLRSLNYPDADIMARVVAARTIVDEDERLAEYAALEKKIVEEDAAWLPMYTRAHLFVVNYDRIEHFTPHWAGYSDFNVYGVTMK